MTTTPTPRGPRHLAETTNDAALLEIVARTGGPDLPRRAPRHRARPTGNAVVDLDATDALNPVGAAKAGVDYVRRTYGPQADRAALAPRGAGYDIGARS